MHTLSLPFATFAPTMFLPRDAMHKRGLCRRAVAWLDVTFVYCVETARRYGHSCYGMQIGNRTKAFERCHF